MPLIDITIINSKYSAHDVTFLHDICKGYLKVQSLITLGMLSCCDVLTCTPWMFADTVQAFVKEIIEIIKITRFITDLEPLVN
jgi:hypothetical protein